MTEAFNNTQNLFTRQMLIEPEPTDSASSRSTERIDFDSITLKNDVMFSSVFRDPENCKELLQRILGIEISELTIAEDQKNIKTKPWSKGIRLDIYVKDIHGNVYDIEMQVLNTGDLELRSRYYHSEMDSYQILAGQKYTQLKASIVIFLCDFDLFQENRSIYTFQSLCTENPDIRLKDARSTIFINLKGDRKKLSPKLTALLDYLKTASPADDFTDKLNHQVHKLRNDFEWRENYMTLEMKMEERFDAGMAQGMKQGLEQGLEQGSIKCMQELILAKLHKGKSITQIADECEKSEETIRQIMKDMNLPIDN